MLAIELGGTVSRPHSGQYKNVEPFLWADLNENNCTLGVRCIDCYFEPLSICHSNHENFYAYQQQYHLNMSQMKEDIKYLGEGSLDFCALGRKTKKSSQWVLGQLYHYILRPRKQDMAIAVANRKDWVFNQLTRKSNSIIGVHIRGGIPDGNRHPANISYYIGHIDKIAEQFARMGSPVEVVYICSDQPAHTYISTAYLQTHYPRPFKYVDFPHLDIGFGEIELLLRKNHTTNVQYQLMADYLSDIEILASVDFFLGSRSNVYQAVSLLRVARGIHSRFTSCFVDILHVKDPPMICESDPEVDAVYHIIGGTMF